MEMTKEEFMILVSHKENIQNIYDLLVLLFSTINGAAKKKYKASYNSFLQKSSERWGKLELLNDEFLKEILSFDAYLNKFFELLNPENVRYYAFKMLFSFDHYLKEQDEYNVLGREMHEIQENTHNSSLLLGPLNTDQSEYCLYLMPKEHYVKDYNNNLEKKKRIRFMEQSDFGRIDSKITSYKIIRTNKYDGSIEIRSYDKINLSSLKEVRIAVIPVSPQPWFVTKYVEQQQGEGYFIIEDDADKVDEINERYIRLLSKCMEHNINIVIFPELSRNKKTKDVVREFLIERTLSDNNPLELVFLGSLWENGRNEGVLLSGAGTELLTVQKNNAYDKEIDGVVYKENLTDVVGKNILIDILGLGRIQYLVCKDGLDAAAQSAMWADFEIAFSIISAYSESISHFDELGKTFAELYGGIQVLTNACEPRMRIAKEKDEALIELGNIIYPCGCCKDNRPSHWHDRYEANRSCWEECNKNNGIGSCIRIFALDREQRKEEDGFFGLFISSDDIFIDNLGKI